MVRQIKLSACILFLALIVVPFSWSHFAFAQSETAYDLVNTVNELRALYGLPPYKIDPWLMEYAQEHSEYQAARQSGTHEHSDGTLAMDIGLVENVAGGDEGVVTVAIVVYEIWVDWGHRNTLIGYSTGEIGAGLALAKNGQIYYTVEVRPGEAVAVTPVYETPVSETDTPYEPLITSTPNEDGSIIHIVKYGETLWSIAIAYGVSIDEIRQLNGLGADSTVIQIGQKLLIRMAYTITPTAPEGEIYTPTETPTLSLREDSISTITPSPSSDVRQSLTAITVTPGLRITPTPTFSTTILNTVTSNHKTIAIILIVVAIALIPLLILSFRESGSDKKKISSV